MAKQVAVNSNNYRIGQYIWYRTPGTRTIELVEVTEFKANKEGQQVQLTRDGKDRAVWMSADSTDVSADYTDLADAIEKELYAILDELEKEISEVIADSENGVEKEKQLSEDDELREIESENEVFHNATQRDEDY